MKQISNLKKLTMLIVCIILSVSTIAQSWPPEGINGNGLTEATAWEITTPEQLATLSNYTNGNNMTTGRYFKLMNDIDLSNYSEGAGWLPIGSSYPFQGNFDGNGKVVRNLTINRPTQDNIGLFGSDVSNANIKNLGVENCNITGRYNVGGLVGGMAWQCTVTNCYVTGSVSGMSGGGLMANAHYSTITNCFTTGNISAVVGVGGLVGGNHCSAITNCFSTGNVNGMQSVGGLVGANSGECNSYVSIITNCYATGSVSAQDGDAGSVNVGGLVGNNSSAIISNCYATGDVSVTGRGEHVGGLVGTNGYNASITNSYATGNIKGIGIVGGLSGNNIAGSTINSCYATGNVSGIQYIGGLVGYNGSIIKNCVAANDSVIVTSGNYVNRVTNNHGSAQNNYANSDMAVMQNGTQLILTDSTGKNMGILKSLTFYTTDSLWNVSAWDFTAAWNICDGTGLPFLRWQDINCGEFTPVTNIIGVPTTTIVNEPVGLTVVVLPYNATNTTIVWSVNNADTTGASITGGNIFNAATAGTAEVKATIVNGEAIGIPYTQDFSIIVNKTIAPTPAVPTLASSMSASITLNTIANGEYRRGTNAWQSSPTFTNLTPNTAYSFTQRTVETATHFASSASPAAIFSTEDAILPLYTIVSSTGNVVFGSITPYGETNVEEGDDITFTIMATNGYEIDQVLIDGINNSAAVATGEYTFYNVTANHTIAVNFKQTVGIAEVTERKIKIYPNPTNGQLKIENGELEIESVKIYDMLGNNCLSPTFSQSHETTINISHLPSGIYFMKIKITTGELIQKIIKD